MFILKQLRGKKNSSQTDLAEAIGVGLRTIQLYEKKGANIPIKNLEKIAEYFMISISELYAKEVNEEDVTYVKENNKKDKLHTIIKLAPGKYSIACPFVTATKQEEYSSEYKNKVFLEELPKITFVVEKVSVTNYICFEISNNSMKNEGVYSLPSRSIVLGKQVSLKELVKVLDKNIHTYWIIILDGVVMCKQITGYNANEKIIICHSLNASPEYPDFTINLEDIKLLFGVIKRQVD